jgi:predicted lipid-binding transport protein (Tim44 family)
LPSGYVYIPPDTGSGLPLWAIVPLTVIGCAIGLWVAWGIGWLLMRPIEARIRRRAHEVQAAAGDGLVYGAPAVLGAAERLFAQVQAAFDADDRQRLAQLSTPDLMADWTKRLDGYAAGGKRYEVAITKGPRIQYVGLLADSGRVRVRIRARLRRGYRLANGKRRGLGPRFEEYWTLVWQHGEWIAAATRPARFRKQYCAEKIVPEPSPQLL